ncbi:MAG TPA: 4-(cytidine 5'-diphospho)-2-C-methyl-D-erythritol kinase, partial [Acidimicrobiia bacterium]|nr:4-(cytidine 5'-diphospho)-2-C-methyl-D-erythritol kinase [Acidimicrobiia bacterium]
MQPARRRAYLSLAAVSAVAAAGCCRLFGDGGWVVPVFAAVAGAHAVGALTARRSVAVAVAGHGTGLALLLAERVGGLKVGEFTLDKVLPVAAGIGGGSADAAAALRLLARLNGLALDDARVREVALATGADVPVCLASYACDMTGVGEILLPLNLPELPCVMVNPRVPVATKDVFAALGLRNGELLVGVTDVIQAAAWPEKGASITDWVEELKIVPNDLEAPAMRIQPAIGEVLSALRASEGVLLARMSGSGATCFALFSNAGEAERAAQKVRAAHPQWW